MPKGVDLTGKTIDGMAVLGPTKDENNRTRWLCRCSCGALMIRRTDQIRKRQVTCKSAEHKGLTYKNGYALKWAPDHPRENRGRVREHILVVEEQIGRYLVKGENVHHKNGVRDDNRPENLELWVSHQPNGQRPMDMIAHAFATLKQYLPLLKRKDYASQEKETRNCDSGRYSDLPSTARRSKRPRRTD